MSSEDYKKCVDDKIQNEFDLNNISCIPSWLSDKNQCTQTYPADFFGKFLKNYRRNFINMVGILRNIRLEDECRQSCKETTYVVDEGSKFINDFSSAIIIFTQKVIITEK